MFTLRPRLNQLLLLILTLTALPAVQANCKRIYNGNAVLDGYTAQITFGRINLTSTYLQPVGTALGTTITDSATATGLACNSRESLSRIENYNARTRKLVRPTRQGRHRNNNHATNR